MAQDRDPAAEVAAGKDTIAAIATPAGSGALGVLRVSGPGAQDVARALLRPAPREPRRATLARAWDGDTPVDEVVAVFFPGPGSASGEDVLEVSAHGSPLILRRLLEASLKAGARLSRPGEFTQRAFLNGRLDLAQAEAVCDLIRARTEGARRAALSQLEGGLSRAVAQVRESVLGVAVRIEASLDHPEEDLPGLAPGEARALLSAAAEPLRRLARTFHQGRLLREGARVCIVGRPNAGKSSLLNALLGTERAIVCAQPGTTRDTLEEPADLQGLPAVLIDTAGLREESSDPAELAGMSRAEGALRASDLALLVIDGSRPQGPEDLAVHRRLLESAAREGRPVIPVLNKADLGSCPDGRAAGLPVSAVTREGLEELVREVGSRLSGAPTGEEEPVLVTSARHRQALELAASELESADRAVLEHPGRWEDRAACHLRGTLLALDEILGVGTPDEVLRGIFARFCVGK